METFIIAIMAFVIGITVANTYWKNKIQSIIGELNESTNEVKPRLVMVEKHNNSYMAYDAKTDSFIAQENNLDDLLDALLKINPSIALGSKDDDLKDEILELSKRS